MAKEKDDAAKAQGFKRGLDGKTSNAGITQGWTDDKTSSTARTQGYNEGKKKRSKTQAAKTASGKR
jgi:hypothetical protein